jgi:hypothetical protein
MPTDNQTKDFIYARYEVGMSRKDACTYAGITSSQSNTIIKKNNLPTINQKIVNDIPADEILNLARIYPTRELARHYGISPKTAMHIKRCAELGRRKIVPQYLADIFNPNVSIEELEAKLMRQN